MWVWNEMWILLNWKTNITAKRILFNYIDFYVGNSVSVSYLELHHTPDILMRGETLVQRDELPISKRTRDSEWFESAGSNQYLYLRYSTASGKNIPIYKKYTAVIVTSTYLKCTNVKSENKISYKKTLKLFGTSQSKIKSIQK